MNPVGYALRLRRSQVRRRAPEPPWLTPTPVTSRNPSMVHRVNPAGNLAYMVRTMARPKSSMVLTAKERDRIDQADPTFRSDFDPTFRSDFLDWRAAVEKYAQAKGLGRVEWYVEEDYSIFGGTIFHWKEAQR